MDKSVPKYQQLIDYLVGMIRDGRILPGQQLPTEMELAHRFDISRHTVRNALNKLEHNGLIVRRQGMGTFCRERVSAERRIVAVLTTYISDYIFPSIIRGVEKVLSSEGYLLLLANTWNDREQETKCLEKLVNEDLSGLIIEPTSSALQSVDYSFFRELEKKGVPLLFLHATYPELDSPGIIMDDEQGGYTATQYLLQLGHHRIAGIFKSDDLQGIRRQAGFERAMQEHQCEVDPSLIGNYETKQLISFPYQFTLDLIKKNDPPTAIVAYNDQIALKAIEAIRDEGLGVPEDISIVGYDDSNLATASEVKLTTIRHPKEEMGRHAARTMIGMIEAKVENPSFVYAPELVVRTSCISILK
jgi:GntR family transcriptional regulator of arabinose operon